MVIRVKGLAGDPRFHAFVVDRMRTALERARVRAGTATVAFTDENGPKGGLDIRCALVVGLPGRGTLRVDEVAANHELAFDQSFTVFARQVAERRNRRRALARRPKKYYLAKGLLAGGASTAPPDGAGVRARPAARRRPRAEGPP